MPENNQTNTSLINDTQAPKVPTASSSVASPAVKPAPKTTPPAAGKTDAANAETPSSPDLMQKVATKIADAHNVLIALSSDPSVDEIAAAIGLSLYLDKLGKRATAIYSGVTPNALEFLKPEDTFDKTADTLQDFVIALNKDKADHLRYKLDGDYVKVYITPYRSRIGEEDLEFSYGDFNIDLVIALNVANGVDLDSALREHGRIMHDASVINITTNNPGKFGEIEWSDKDASSICEMVARLLYNSGGKTKIQPEEATAFLTGIVAATDRFSQGNTTAETMKVASNLMESGADQQLIAKNITADINNEFSLGGTDDSAGDPTTLDINHLEEEPTVAEPAFDPSVITPQEPEPEPETEAEDPEKDSLLEELRAAEAGLANAGAETTPETGNEPVRLEEPENPINTASEAEAPAPEATPTTEEKEVKPEKVITPPADFVAETLGEGTNKYGQMLEEALSEPTGPLAAAVPEVASAPEINGVPKMDFLPMPDDQILPPPPTPPVDFASLMPNPTVVAPTEPAASAPVEPITPAPAAEPVAPVAQATPTATSTSVETPVMPTVEPALATPITPATPATDQAKIPQPAMQDQVYHPQATSPDAFKIPGM
ncbi:MAG: hypothetical protein Q4B65_02715 [Candidatus Saccharibacteria bacterium]|nr:hypothetical protein [Candidatus Saccharibacteria bacterium]